MKMNRCPITSRADSNTQPSACETNALAHCATSAVHAHHSGKVVYRNVRNVRDRKPLCPEIRFQFKLNFKIKTISHFSTRQSDSKCGRRSRSIFFHPLYRYVRAPIYVIVNFKSMSP